MQRIAVALAASFTLVGTSAHPMDIENNARWLVLDGLAMPPGQAQQVTRINDLRTVELAGEAAGLAAVCGTIEFGHDDEGVTNFVVFYAERDRRLVAVAPPFFYGTGPAPGGEPDQRIAQAACGGAEPAIRPAAASR